MKTPAWLQHPIRSLRAAWKTREVAVLRSTNELLAEDLRHTRELLAQRQELPAELAQLRVHGMSVRQRTGYGVTAFIPEGIVDKIKVDAGLRAAFIKMVAESLVESAVSGLLNINSRGKVSALIFEHERDSDGKYVASKAMHVFDSDIKGYHMADSTTTRKQICEGTK